MGCLVSDQGEKEHHMQRAQHVQKFAGGKRGKVWLVSGARRQRHRLRLGDRQGPDHSGPHRPQQGVWTSDELLKPSSAL